MMYNLGDKLIHRVSKALWTVESKDKGIYVIVMRIGMHARHLELSKKELKEDYIKVGCEKNKRRNGEKRKMKSKQEINQWIIKNCWNDLQKYYDLSCLTFDASVTINCMNVKGNIDQSCQVCQYLDQSCQKATTCIDQSNQECGEDLYQNCQKVGGDLIQDYQKVDGDLIQDCQKVDGDLIQDYQKVGGDLIQDKAKKEILDKVEREYLASVIKPFKDKVKSIIKFSCMFSKEQEYIWLNMADGIVHSRLPSFSSGTMYKGMKVGKDYTLKELGL